MRYLSRQTGSTLGIELPNLALVGETPWSRVVLIPHSCGPCASRMHFYELKAVHDKTVYTYSIKVKPSIVMESSGVGSIRTGRGDATRAFERRISFSRRRSACMGRPSRYLSAMDSARLPAKVESALQSGHLRGYHGLPLRVDCSPLIFSG